MGLSKTRKLAPLATLFKKKKNRVSAKETDVA
jgi:hypothetical protein